MSDEFKPVTPRSLAAAIPEEQPVSPITEHVQDDTVPYKDRPFIERLTDTFNAHNVLSQAKSAAETIDQNLDLPLAGDSAPVPSSVVTPRSLSLQITGGEDPQIGRDRRAALLAAQIKERAGYENPTFVSPATLNSIQNDLWPQASSVGDYAADIGGALAGDLLTNPVNWAMPGAATIEGSLAKAGAPALLAGMAGVGGSMAVVQGATNPLMQTLEQGAGTRGEVSGSEWALSPFEGFAGGAVIHTGMTGLKAGLKATVGRVADTIAEGWRARMRQLASEDPGLRAPGELPEDVSGNSSIISGQAAETPKTPESLKPVLQTKDNGPDASAALVQRPDGGQALYHVVKEGDGFAIGRTEVDAQHQPTGRDGYLDQAGNAIRPPEDGQTPAAPQVYATKDEALAAVHRFEGLESPEAQKAPGLTPGESADITPLDKAAGEQLPAEVQQTLEHLTGFPSASAEVDHQRAELRDLLTSGADSERIAAHPLFQEAERTSRAIEPTNEKWGPDRKVPSLEWEKSRVFNFGGDAVVGYDHAVQRLGAKAQSYAGGSVAKERQAFIVIGPPAAGKSTFSERIATHERAAIVDPDDAKAVLPEYQGGIGANAVHEESAVLSNRVLADQAGQGYNLVIPKVGHSPNGIGLLADKLRTQGYDVHLINVNVTPEEAFRRMTSRFLNTGRLISPDYFRSIGDKPTGTYNTLRSTEAIASHAEVNANGPRDNQPVTGTGRALEALSAAGGSGQHGSDGARLRSPGDGAEGRIGPDAAAQGHPEALTPEAAEAKAAVEATVAPADQGSAAAAYDHARDAVEIPAAALETFDEKTTVKTTDRAPAGIYVFDATTLNTDALRFQYKEGGDEFGVTNALRDIRKWDPAKANQLIVWQAEDGKLFVVDGHQRSGLARRLIAQGFEDKITIPGLLYREVDGVSPEYVRAAAAGKNIAEGSGTAVDGAKVLRSHPELLDGSIGLGKDVARQAFSLAKLSDDAFRMVVNDVVPANQAAHVGTLIPNDPARQMAAMNALARFEPANEQQAAILVQRVKDAELAKAEAGAQGSMFADLEAVDSTAGEEMKIVDRAIKTLKQDTTLFGRVVAHAARIEETGSHIERSSAQTVRDEAKTFGKVLASEAYARGPIRDTLTAAAREVKNGKRTLEQAVRDVVEAVRSESEKVLSARPDDRAGAGAGASGEGRTVPSEAGRGEPGPAVQGQEAARGLKTEPGAEGLPQTLIPGVEPVTDKERLDLAARKPLQGGDAAPPAGGLFDTGAREQADLLFRKKGATPASVPPGAQPPQAGTAAAAAPTTPVESLQAQAASLAEALGMPLRQGRLANAQAAAQYSQKYGVARVREVADFYSVAHEGGHHLEAEVGAPLKNLVDAHKGELGPLDYDPNRGDAHEGFSEFLALTLTNPLAAQYHAPAFFQAFRTLMAKDHPEFLASLDKAQATYDAWLRAPSGEKLSAQVKPLEGREGYLSEVLQTYKDEGILPTIGRVMADAYTAMFDQHAPVASAVRDLARLMRNAAGAAHVDIKAADNPEVLLRLWSRSQQGAMYQLRYGVVPYRDVRAAGPSLHDALALATGEPKILGRWDSEKAKTFADYLVAKRADVLWDRYHAGQLDRPPVGFSQQDARDGMAAMLAANANLEPAAQQVHTFTRNMLTKQRDAGIITQDLFNQLAQDPFYVPLFRDVSDKPLSVPPRGSANRNEGPGVLDTVKRLRGSSRDIVDPIQGIMMQTFLAERTIRHNEILRAFKGLADRAGPGAGAIVEPIAAKELKGVPFDLAENIKKVAKDRGLNPQDTAILMNSVTNAFGNDPLMGTMFKMEMTSKKGEPILFYKEAGELKALRFQAGREGWALYETLTALPDTISDVWSGTMGLTAGMVRGGITTNPVFAITNYIRDQMALGILRKDYVPFFSGVRGVWDEIRQNEAAQLYSYLGGVAPGAAASGTHKAAEGVINEIGRKSYLANRLTSVHNLLELPALTEAGSRNSVFAKVFEQKQAMGLSPYEAAIEAAYQATDMLDFGRHGSKTIMLRRLIPFFNAHLQGLDKARRTILEPLYRLSVGDVVTSAEKDAVNNAMWSLGKLAGLGTALGAVYAAIVWDREEYRDANSEMKGSHLIIPWGHKIITIPKPFELGLGFTAGEYAYAALAGHDPRAAGQFMDAASGVLMPPNPITANPLIKTTFELGLNRSLFTGRDIVPERIRDNVPSMQYTTNTSPLAKELGKLTGLSPMKIDYAIGSFFGMWGKDIQSASNWFADADEKPATLFEDTVFMRRFLKDPNRSGEMTQRFYQFAAQKGGEFAQALGTFKDQFASKFQDPRALEFLKNLTDEKKAYVVLQGGASPDDPYKKAFTADERRVHPLTRAQGALSVLNGLARDLTYNAQVDTDSNERIEMTPTQRRDAIEALHQLGAQEMRNALVMLKDPGYDGRPLLDTQKQFDVLAAISPETAENVRRNYATAKILPTKTVADAWPEMKKLLIRDGSYADLSDVTVGASTDGYEFGGERGKRKAKRGVQIPAAETTP